MSNKNQTQRGFTLVELLAVIAIIGVLIGLTLPAIQSVRESARRTSCSNKLKQIALGLHSFQSSMRNLPSGIRPQASDKFPSLTWLAQILPYIEQQNLWDRTTQEFSANSNPFTHSNQQQLINTYACPSDPNAGRVHFTHENRIVALTNYLGVNGTNWENQDGVLYLNSRTKFSEIKDGLSNTLMAGERPPSPDYWYGWWYVGYGQQGTGSVDMLLGVNELNAPPIPGETTYLEQCPAGPYQFEVGNSNEQCDALHFWSHHPSGAHFALCDGSIQFLAYTVDNDVLLSLATKSGGETFESPW